MCGIRYSECKSRGESWVSFLGKKGKGFHPPQVECCRNGLCHLRGDGKFISFQVKKDCGEGRGRTRTGRMVRAHKTHTTIRRRGFFKDEGNEVKQEGEKEKGRRGSVDSSQRQYIFEGNSRGMYDIVWRARHYQFIWAPSNGCYYISIIETDIQWRLRRQQRKQAAARP